MSNRLDEDLPEIERAALLPEAGLIPTMTGEALDEELRLARKELTTAQRRVKALLAARLSLGKSLAQQALKEVYGVEPEPDTLESVGEDPMRFTALLPPDSFESGQTELAIITRTGNFCTINLDRTAFQSGQQATESFLGATAKDLSGHGVSTNRQIVRLNTALTREENIAYEIEQAQRRLTWQLLGPIIQTHLVLVLGNPFKIEFDPLNPAQLIVTFKKEDGKEFPQTFEDPTASNYIHFQGSNANVVVYLVSINDLLDSPVTLEATGETLATAVMRITQQIKDRMNS